MIRTTVIGMILFSLLAGCTRMQELKPIFVQPSAESIAVPAGYSFVDVVDGMLYARNDFTKRVYQIHGGIAQNEVVVPPRYEILSLSSRNGTLIVYCLNEATDIVSECVAPAETP